VIKTGPDVNTVYIHAHSWHKWSKQGLMWTQFTHTRARTHFANAVTNLGGDTDYPEQNLSFFPQSLQENSGTAGLTSN